MIVVPYGLKQMVDEATWRRIMLAQSLSSPNFTPENPKNSELNQDPIEAGVVTDPSQSRLNNMMTTANIKRAAPTSAKSGMANAAQSSWNNMSSLMKMYMMINANNNLGNYQPLTSQYSQWGSNYPSMN